MVPSVPCAGGVPMAKDSGCPSGSVQVSWIVFGAGPVTVSLSEVQVGGWLRLPQRGLRSAAVLVVIRVMPVPLALIT